jgi:hypothetical protein
MAANENPNYKITTSSTTEKDSFITISGIVMDSASNKHLDYVAVILKDKNEKSFQMTYSDEDGSFNFKIPKKSINEISFLEIKDIHYKPILIDLFKKGIMNLFVEIKLPRKIINLKKQIIAGKYSGLIEPTFKDKPNSSPIKSMPR